MTDANRRYVRVKSTDATVVCELRTAVIDRQQLLFVKMGTPSQPQIRSVYIFVYADSFCATAAFVLQIFVHAVNRVNIELQQGDVSRVPLMLK